MWKVLIADDEPKIRKGLKTLLSDSGLELQIVGEAEDGEVAYDIAKALEPDIMLVDINMPFLNGLKLIEMTKEILPDTKIIIVTGYDEFTYAQLAIKLQVFDFLLKPIVREQLLSVVSKAMEELSCGLLKKNYLKWARQQMERNLPLLREKLMGQWVNGHLTSFELEDQTGYLGILIPQRPGLTVIKLAERLGVSEAADEWDRNLLLFAVQNIAEELLGGFKPNIIFRDDKENIVALSDVREPDVWLEAGHVIEDAVSKHLGQVVLVCQKQSPNGPEGVPETYEDILGELADQMACTPIVLLAKKYIEAHYFIRELSLQDAAAELKISAAYLSRLLKQETGASFVDYVTKVRIKRAIQLLNNPSEKIYEVADKVGYSTQHYFCTAFKKILGVSPAEYRKGGKKP